MEKSNRIYRWIINWNLLKKDTEKPLQIPNSDNNNKPAAVENILWKR